jgi:hypothetical protein
VSWSLLRGATRPGTQPRAAAKSPVSLPRGPGRAARLPSAAGHARRPLAEPLRRGNGRRPPGVPGVRGRQQGRRTAAPAARHRALAGELARLPPPCGGSAALPRSPASRRLPRWRRPAGAGQVVSACSVDRADQARVPAVVLAQPAGAQHIAVRGVVRDSSFSACPGWIRRPTWRAGAGARWWRRARRR